METMDKIKSVLRSDLSAYEIEKKTGVTRPSIINMRKPTYDFSKMSFQTGEKLAAFYDQERDATLVLKDQGGFLTFSSSLDRLLKDLVKNSNLGQSSEDKAMQEVLNKIVDNVLKDSYSLEDLYELYKEYYNRNK